MCPRSPVRRRNLQVEALAVQNQKVGLDPAVHLEPRSAQNHDHDQDPSLDLTHGDTLIGAIHGPDRVPTHTEGDPAADLIRPSIDRGEGAVVIHQCLAEGAMQEVERAMCRRNTEEH